MDLFQFFFPPRLVFGQGKFATLGDEACKLGRRALLVTYPSKSLSRFVEQALEMLRQSGVSCVIFNEATANPTHTLINKGSAMARQEGCDVVIGLGGGSAMDTAKLIATAAPRGLDIWEIFEKGIVVEEALPVVAVPTTAGSGSDATYYAVVSHPGLQRKEGFARPQFFPKVSIIDPLLTVSLPARMTAETGMDVLTHAVEAYTSRLASPISDLFAEEAIRLVGRYLRRAVENGSDLEARSGMLLGNTLAGVAITHADTCLAHVIGEAVGAVFNTGHALSVALTLPAVMEYNCMTNLPKYAAITRLFGDNERNDLTAAKKSAELVRTLIHDLHLPAGLASLGVTESDQVTALVNRPGMDASNPRSTDPHAFALLIEGSLSPAMSYWAAGGQ